MLSGSEADHALLESELTIRGAHGDAGPWRLLLGRECGEGCVLFTEVRRSVLWWWWWMRLLRRAGASLLAGCCGSARSCRSLPLHDGGETASLHDLADESSTLRRAPTAAISCGSTGRLSSLDERPLTLWLAEQKAGSDPILPALTHDLLEVVYETTSDHLLR